MSRGKEQGQARFRGDQWFQRIVDSRTRAALKERGEEFARSHASASRESLLEYVRSEAKRLGFTPDMGEIIGGSFIAYRFHGCWPLVIQAAGLRPNSRQPKLCRRQIYKEEFARQAELFRQERAAAKEQRRLTNKARAELEAETRRQSAGSGPSGQSREAFKGASLGESGVCYERES